MEKIITANEVREKIFKTRKGAVIEMLNVIENFSQLDNLRNIESKTMVNLKLSEKFFNKHDGFSDDDKKLINAKLDECGVYLCMNTINKEIYLELTEAKKEEYRKIIDREIDKCIVQVNGVMNGATSFDDAATQVIFTNRATLSKAFNVFKQAGYDVSIGKGLWLDIHVEPKE